jgi:hypothetical protein
MRALQSWPPSPDHGIGAVRRLFRVSVRHGNSPFEMVAMSCASRHQGRTAWCLPARDRGLKEMTKTGNTIRVVGHTSSKAGSTGTSGSRG